MSRAGLPVSLNRPAFIVNIFQLGPTSSGRHNLMDWEITPIDPDDAALVPRKSCWWRTIRNRHRLAPTDSMEATIRFFFSSRNALEPRGKSPPKHHAATGRVDVDWTMALTESSSANFLSCSTMIFRGKNEPSRSTHGDLVHQKLVSEVLCHHRWCNGGHRRAKKRPSTKRKKAPPPNENPEPNA